MKDLRKIEKVPSGKLGAFLLQKIILAVIIASYKNNNNRLERIHLYSSKAAVLSQLGGMFYEKEKFTRVRAENLRA